MIDGTLVFGAAVPITNATRHEIVHWHGLVYTRLYIITDQIKQRHKEKNHQSYNMECGSLCIWNLDIQERRYPQTGGFWDVCVWRRMD